MILFVGFLILTSASFLLAYSNPILTGVEAYQVYFQQIADTSGTMASILFVGIIFIATERKRKKERANFVTIYENLDLIFLTISALLLFLALIYSNRGFLHSLDGDDLRTFVEPYFYQSTAFYQAGRTGAMLSLLLFLSNIIPFSPYRLSVECAGPYDDDEGHVEGSH